MVNRFFHYEAPGQIFSTIGSPRPQPFHVLLEPGRARGFLTIVRFVCSMDVGNLRGGVELTKWA